MAVFQTVATLVVLSLLLSMVTVQSFQSSSPGSWTRTNIATTSSSTTELSLAARRPFISGNWKLNPQTRDEAIQLATDIAASVQDGKSPEADIALFVPYVFIESTMNVVQNKLMIGAEVSYIYICFSII
jgi:hypothetical protein